MNDDTPRTTAALRTQMINEGIHDGAQHWRTLVFVEPEFARQLERELKPTDQFERRGDAVIRWITTLVFTLCGAAALAAYAAQYLAGK